MNKLLKGSFTVVCGAVAVEAVRRLVNSKPQPKYDPWERSPYKEFSHRVLVVGGGFAGYTVAKTLGELIGDREAPGTKALLETVYSSYLPNKVVAGRSEGDEEAMRLVPLLADRSMRGGEATAYVCVNYACQSPTTEPAELARQLGVG